MGQLRVTCPGCAGDLLVDSETGVVLSHQPSGSAAAAGKNLEDLFRELDASRARAEEVFERERRAHDDRDRILEERFREAVKRAEAEPGDGPPPRPFDHD